MRQEWGMNAIAHHCPTCGTALPSDAPEGLCPKCLLRGVAVPTESASASAHRRPVPPSIEAVAAAFPQLEIHELIGQGGMGCVFKARQPQLNRFVALKILPDALARDAAFAARFTREAQALAVLNHPNIVTIHDFGQSGGFFYLLMEFVDGVNLRQALQASRFTPEQALAIVPPICEALQFAHERGIVHRDIKPENLLLDKSGRVKIADFGIARILGDSSAHADNSALGTPRYMAPEQKQHPHQADHRADIYSLGVVFYEMLTGEAPRGDLQPPSARVVIDVRLDEVVLRALELSPSLRYQTAAELRTQVETIANTPANPKLAGAEDDLPGPAIPVPARAFNTSHEPDPPRSRRGNEAGSSDVSGVDQPIRPGGWSTWYPFQSEDVRQICAHLTEREFWNGMKQSCLLGLLGAVTFGPFLGILFVAWQRGRPSLWPFVVPLGLVCAGVAVWSLAFSRRMYCSTQWAKDHGITPERLRFFSFTGQDDRAIRERAALMGVVALCLPATLSAWFVLFGHRLFGVELDADTQLWAGLVGFPINAGIGVMLAVFTGSFRPPEGAPAVEGRSRWSPRAIAAAVLLTLSVILMGGGMVMLSLVAWDPDWNPAPAEAVTVLVVANGGLIAAVSATLLGWLARKQLRRTAQHERGWAAASAAAWFWPGVTVGLALLSLPMVPFTAERQSPRIEADAPATELSPPPPFVDAGTSPVEQIPSAPSVDNSIASSAAASAQSVHGDPRALVNQWLAEVKANRMPQMWELTTRESGGAGSVDLRNTWNFDRIRAHTLVLGDTTGMVVTTGYRDNAGRDRKIVFSLVQREGRWLIRENAVTSPEGASSRLEGFIAHPSVRYDVRREDVIGRWTDAFFSPATFRFEEDGEFSLNHRVVDGSRTNLQGSWRLEADRLSYSTTAGSITGRVVRVEEDFFQLEFPGGGSSGFHRSKDAVRPKESAGLTREFKPVVELVVSTSPTANHFLTLGDGRLHASLQGEASFVHVDRDGTGDVFIEFTGIYSIRLGHAEGLRRWDEMSATQLMEEFQHAGFALLPFERFSRFRLKQGDLPVTILLPGTGLLQVTGIHEDEERERRVNLRYKLVAAGAIVP